MLSLLIRHQYLLNLNILGTAPGSEATTIKNMKSIKEILVVVRDTAMI
jgi:hypothetical protein